MPPKHRSIVEQLRHAIQHCGETEYGVAKGSGVSQSVVNRFVNGERSISIGTAAKLCEYLRLDLHRRK
jgi:plasmid maintenance system antidote protein VapI